MNPCISSKLNKRTRGNRLTLSQRLKVIELYIIHYLKHTNWVSKVINQAASLNISISKTGIKLLVKKFLKKW